MVQMAMRRLKLSLGAFSFLPLEASCVRHGLAPNDL